MLIHGDNLLIYAGGSVVAAAKSCKILMDVETIETAGTDDGQFRCYVASMSSWSVSVDKLVEVVKDLFLNDGQTVTVSFVVRDMFNNLSGDRMTGHAFVVNAGASGSVSALVKGSLTFQGTGALAQDVVGLNDYYGTELYDYNGNSRLCAPSSNL